MHTFQKINALGNINFWVKKYCKNQDIVVIANADDKLIGRQILKILNSVYESPNIWYVYSKFIVTTND